MSELWRPATTKELAEAGAIRGTMWIRVPQAEADVLLAKMVRGLVRSLLPVGEKPTIEAFARLSCDERAVMNLCFTMGEYLASEVQPCSHPASAIVSSSEGTNYCGECAKEADND